MNDFYKDTEVAFFDGKNKPSGPPEAIVKECAKRGFKFVKNEYDDTYRMVPVEIGD